MQPPNKPDVPLLSLGQVVVPSSDLDASMRFFDDHGFALTQIFPADDPSTAVVEGHGLTLRVQVGSDALAPYLRVEHAAPANTVVGPDGVTVEFVERSDELDIGELVSSFVLTRPDGDVQVGRAGMHYRDLIPDRQGGRFIASHIRIVEGGPVADYVHHHHIRFQVIFCHRGWVDVVYEEQGQPFRLEAGDLVIQPPHIRHQVLASSAGCEVVEIGCPALHATLTDRALALPNSRVDHERDFGGQRFVRHKSAGAAWTSMPAEWGGWVAQDSGVGVATDGLAGARLIRPGNLARQATFEGHGDELRFYYVRSGTATLLVPGHIDTEVSTDDAFVIPPASPWRLHQTEPGFEVFEVRLPAAEEQL